jgi:hypothetical protein
MTLSKVQYIVVPTFFPMIIAVPEVNFPSVTIFLYVFNYPEIMTLQLQFKLREEVEIAWS